MEEPEQIFQFDAHENIPNISYRIAWIFNVYMCCGQITINIFWLLLFSKRITS